MLDGLATIRAAPVVAPARQILGDEDDLFDPAGRQRAHLGQDLGVRS